MLITYIHTYIYIYIYMDQYQHHAIQIHSDWERKNGVVNRKRRQIPYIPTQGEDVLCHILLAGPSAHRLDYSVMPNLVLARHPFSISKTPQSVVSF